MSSKSSITRPMKIAMIGPVYPYRGGIAHYTTSLARALMSASHRLQMISFKRQYPAFLYPGESDKDPSANPFRVEASYLLDPLYPWTWRQAARSILGDIPDLVLVHWWTTFWGPAYAALAYQLGKRIPVVYLIHNVLPHEARPWDRWLAQAALGQGEAFIVQARHEEERLLGLIPTARITYCEHPIYQRFSEENISKEAARRRLGLPLDRPLALFFGIVRPYKGLRVLVEALAHAGAPVHLVVAGEFWEDQSGYRDLIRDLGVAGNVTLIDRYIPNEEAHLLFSAADAVVAPYVGGTQSGVVELAIGYGLPSIVTSLIAAGIADPGGQDLRVVPSGDVPALSTALKMLGQDLPGSREPRPAPDDWGRMVGAIERVHGLLKGPANEF